MSRTATARRPAWRWRPLGRRGASTAELALVSVPLLVMLLGGLELARYAATLASLRAVTDDAWRQVVLLGYANMAAGRSACDSLAAGRNMLGTGTRTYLLDRQKLSIAVTGCTPGSPVATVSLQSRYAYSFLVIPLAAHGGTLVEDAMAVFN